MSISRLWPISFSLAFVWITGCVELRGVPMGSYLDDRNLQAQVEEYFAKEKSPALAGVKPTVADRIIYLYGTVPSTEAKIRAEQIAFRVTATRGVVNRLEVELPR
jgi:osmotically-inducible protein OsmY